MRFTIGLAVLLTAMAGCGDDDAPGGGVDSGPAGVDSGPGGDDAGGEGEEDAGGEGEEDSGMMMMGGGCAADYAGCSTFDDLTGGTAAIDITGFMYTPKCIRVRVGQSVTIEAAGIHPLMGACGPMDMNPIPDMSTTPQTVTFDTAGVYGFHCNNHGTPDGGGMAGAIEVVP